MLITGSLDRSYQEKQALELKITALEERLLMLFGNCVGEEY